MFPTIGVYNQLIQTKGSSAFKSLSHLNFIPSRTLPVKIYSFGSGSYAVVFKATNADRQYAIRCFISADQENIDRYRSIHEYLSSVKASWLTHLELLENEITVESKAYPIIKMDWIEGKLLNNYIDTILTNNTALTALQEEIVSVSQSLESHKVGHGDIQCGNVLVTPSVNGKPIIKLIDYDGMYVPSLANRLNLERGRIEFQHPHRLRQAYNEKIDRFSFWVILCALEALKYDKSLWKEVMQGGYNTLDNVLFTGEDLRVFNSSALVTRLYSLQKQSLSFYLDKLNKFCNSSPNEVEPPCLAETFPSRPFVPLPKVEEEVSTTSDGTFFITSNPSGAPVLTSMFKRLGSTPLYLDNAMYRGQTLIVSYGTQIKQIEILGDCSEFNLTFSEVLPTAPPKFEPTAPVQSITSPGPVQQSPPVQQPEGASSRFILVMSILVLLIVGWAIWSLESKKRQKEAQVPDYSGGYSNTTVTDTTSYSTDQSNETLIPTDTTSPWTEPTSPVVTDTTALSPEYTAQNNSSYVDAASRTAIDVVDYFFSSLNQGDCNNAWRVTFNPTWENKGKEWFCSYEAFGTVSKVQVEQAYTITESSTEALVYAYYYAEDPINGNKCFKQNVTVKKTFIADGYYWMIIRLTNLEEPYDCELKD